MELLFLLLNEKQKVNINSNFPDIRLDSSFPHFFFPFFFRSEISPRPDIHLELLPFLTAAPLRQDGRPPTAEQDPSLLLGINQSRHHDFLTLHDIPVMKKRGQVEGSLSSS